MYTIEVDYSHAMLVAKGVGYWTLATARAYLEAERDALDKLNMPLSEVMILFDASAFTVQSQEVIRLLRHPANPLWNVKRGAFVSPPGLRFMQIKQGAETDRIKVFEYEAEARQYLLNDGMRPGRYIQR